MIDVFQQELGEESHATAVQDPPAPATTGAVIALNDRRPVHSGRGGLRDKVDRFRAKIGLPASDSPQPANADTAIGLSSAEQDQVIDSLIVARAFKPGRARRRWCNWRPREILVAIAGGALTLGLLWLVIYWSQTM